MPVREKYRHFIYILSDIKAGLICSIILKSNPMIRHSDAERRVHDFINKKPWILRKLRMTDSRKVPAACSFPLKTDQFSHQN